MNDDVWTLHRRADGRTLADLVVTGADFPWLTARVEPGDGFEAVVPLFAEELRLVDRIDEDMETNPSTRTRSPRSDASSGGRLVEVDGEA
ncbi:hypothetical protein [Actinoplanes sp. HUAS TT8]|uniref:hypothetical protein n=1 Tax=Actinoplanes sp. HUAS TT8 TaxID=3447453 RepID=UPI003F521910